MSKKKTTEKDTFVCPVGKFFMTFERKGERKSEVFDHLSKSGIEFLRAVRSLVDDQIERLEKRERPTAGERMTKIEVE